MAIKHALIVALFVLAGPIIGHLLARTIICLKEQSNCSVGYHFHAKGKPCWEFPRDLFRKGSWD